MCFISSAEVCLLWNASKYKVMDPEAQTQLLYSCFWCACPSSSHWIDQTFSLLDLSRLCLKPLWSSSLAQSEEALLMFLHSLAAFLAFCFIVVIVLCMLLGMDVCIRNITYLERFGCLETSLQLFHPPYLSSWFRHLAVALKADCITQVTGITGSVVDFWRPVLRLLYILRYIYSDFYN